MKLPPYKVPVYVSYSRKDEEKYKIVEKLVIAFEKERLNLLVDKECVKPRESFDKFIKDIGSSDIVIIILSKAYFDSFYCMLELSRILKRGDTKSRVVTMFPDGFNIGGCKGGKLKKDWEDKYSDWDKKSFKETLECNDVYGDTKEIELIIEKCNQICEVFSRTNADVTSANIKNQSNEAIKAVKDLFLKNQCQLNTFKEAAEYWKRLVVIGSSFVNRLNEMLSEEGYDTTNEKKIGCILLFQIKELFDTSDDSLSKENKTLIFDFFMTLFPLYVLPQWKENFKAKIEGRKESTDNCCLLPSDCYSSAYVEITISSLDNRRACLKSIKQSEKNPDTAVYIPMNTHCLGLPPEVGSNDLYYNDIVEDIVERTGGNEHTVNNSIEKEILNNYGYNERKIHKFTNDVKEKRIKSYLHKNGYLYLIPQFYSDDEEASDRKLWGKIAEKLFKKYKDILVIYTLDEEINDIEEREELELLKIYDPSFN